MYLHWPGSGGKISSAASKEYIRSSINISSSLHGRAEPGWDTKTDRKPESGGRRVRKLDVLQGMRTSGVACTGLRFSRRHVENHIERHGSPPGCGCVVIVYSSLFRHAFAGRSSVCVVAMTTIVSGKVVRTQKYQTSVRFFLRRRCPPSTGWTQDLRYWRHLCPSHKVYGDTCEMPPKWLLFIAALFSAICACVYRFNWEWNAFYFNRDGETFIGYDDAIRGSRKCCKYRRSGFISIKRQESWMGYLIR